MNVLIIEQEAYLAQSIANSLIEKKQAKCKIFTNFNDAKKEKTNFNVVLLSSHIPANDLYKAIEYYKDSIIILLVSYISNDTVIEPIKKGANDYILKPLMIEEVLRKIDNLIEFEKIKAIKKSYENYLDNLFQDFENNLEVNLPLIITSQYRQNSDALAYKLAKEQNKEIVFQNVKNLNTNFLEDINVVNYIIDFDILNNNQKQEFLEKVSNNKNIIIYTNSEVESKFNKVKLSYNNNVFMTNEILCIDDYIKYIITNFQYKYPDTELSKLLGISRKSLWEKRKKYEIFKKR